MQSIRDQEEEGEHILSLDLQSVQTAAQSTGICRGEVTKLGPHYAVHKSSRSGYRTITLIVIRIFSWRIFLFCKWGTPQTTSIDFLNASTFWFNVFHWFSLSVHISWRLRMWDWIWKGAGGWCQGGDQSQFRLSACSAAVHTADWCFIILSLHVSIFYIFYSVWPEARNVPERQKADVDSERLWW